MAFNQAGSKHVMSEKHTFPAVDGPGLGTKSAVSSFKQRIPILFDELLGMVVVSVALDNDASPLAIASAAADIVNVILACKHLRAVCVAEKAVWANIPALMYSSCGSPFRPVTQAKINMLLAAGRGCPLRIAFDLAVSFDQDSEALRIWRTLLSHRERWDVLHVSAPYRCKPFQVCLHSLVSEADFARSFVMTSVTFKTIGRLFSCPGNHSIALPIDVTGIKSLVPHVSMLPQVTPASLPLLTYVGVLNQDASNWYPILAQCPNLRTLVWGKGNRPGDHGPHSVLLSSLYRLEIDSLVPFPPVDVPGLKELAVQDKLDAFTYEMFGAIFKGASTCLTLLDLLANPIPTTELIDILDKCPKLIHFLVSSRCWDRTACYEELAKRVLDGYVQDDPHRMREVIFEILRDTIVTFSPFARLLGLGQRHGSRVTFYSSVFRVKCEGCRGRFTPGDVKALAEFQKSNGIGDELVALGREEKVSGNLADFSVILIFTTQKAASECLQNPIKFNGRICPTSMVPQTNETEE
ncbi:hypothetical protein C8R47DRAFT_1071658 [Mycena vitilis]|nr:hypothetical protein C8R47DRAFT_1071658 [Mycena vitilis]